MHGKSILGLGLDRHLAWFGSLARSPKPRRDGPRGRAHRRTSLSLRMHLLWPATYVVTVTTLFLASIDLRLPRCSPLLHRRCYVPRPPWIQLLLHAYHKNSKRSTTNERVSTRWQNKQWKLNGWSYGTYIQTTACSIWKVVLSWLPADKIAKKRYQGYIGSARKLMVLPCHMEMPTSHSKYVIFGASIYGMIHGQGLGTRMVVIDIIKCTRRQRPSRVVVI
jgi:hypothetical protein